MLWLYIITPTLGCIRNYVKYKRFKPLYFLRTPLIYLILHKMILLYRGKILLILILERWLLFIFKTFVSIYRNDYIRNKEKYIQKYNLKYK